MQSHEYQIISHLYKEKDYFSEWFDDLSVKLQDIILLRLARIKSGNFGDCKHIEDKIYEVRIHMGAGYRIYFAKLRQKLVILLCAGDKSSQKKDIKKAKEIMKDYLENKK